MTAPTPRYQPPAEPQAIDASNAAHAKPAILVQGMSGSGKTHLACSMPEPIVIGCTEPNISVAVGRIQEGRKITLYPLKNWTDYKWFVRRTKNREWDAATVVLDSYTLVGDFAVTTAMERPAALTVDGNLKQARWTNVKSDQFTELLDLLSATQPQQGKPSYNVLVTVHEQEEVTVDDEGKVRGISAVNPAVPGGLRRSFGAKFDCVFVAQAKPRFAKGGHGVMEPAGVEHVLWAVPPDNLRSVKDGIGGNGGRKILPPTVENTWAALSAAWELKGSK